jgi:hypothetical protein
MQTHSDLLFSAEKGLALDLFLPDKDPRAIVLYLHGGGFTRGSRQGDQSQQLLQKLLGAGLGVAFADYRLGVGAEAFSDAQAEAIFAMQARTKAAGLTVAKGLCGPAMIAAVEDASDAVQALRSGNLCNATKGLPVVILGVSAGGIAGLSLAYPPSEWWGASHPPDGVMALCAAMVQPWRLRADGPPAIMLHGPMDRIIHPSNPRLVARRAARLGAPLRLEISTVRGHNSQMNAFLTGASRDGIPYFSLFEGLLAEIETRKSGRDPV